MGQRPQHRIHDTTTGEITYVDFTDEEWAALKLEKQAAEAESAARDALEQQRQAELDELRGNRLQTALQAAQSDLTLLTDGSPTAQQQRAILARVVRNQIAMIKALGRLL